MLAEAAAAIGDPQVRNRGTLGGSLAHADPAADYPGGRCWRSTPRFTSKGRRAGAW